MVDDDLLPVVAVVLTFPLVLFFVKSWLFATGTPGSTVARVSRIADLDGHLSFDERLARRLRELEQVDPSDDVPPSPPLPAPTGFGRRAV